MKAKELEATGKRGRGGKKGGWKEEVSIGNRIRLSDPTGKEPNREHGRPGYRGELAHVEGIQQDLGPVAYLRESEYHRWPEGPREQHWTRRGGPGKTKSEENGGGVSGLQRRENSLKYKTI